METTAKRRGRPTLSTSKRQEKLVAREALIALGVTIKRGRPAKDPSAVKVAKVKKVKEPSENSPTE